MLAFLSFLNANTYLPPLDTLDISQYPYVYIKDKAQIENFTYTSLLLRSRYHHNSNIHSQNLNALQYIGYYSGILNAKDAIPNDNYITGIYKFQDLYFIYGLIFNHKNMPPYKYYQSEYARLENNLFYKIEKSGNLFY